MTTATGIDGKVLALRLLREGLHVKLISDRTALEVREIADVARRNGMSIDEDGVPHIARAAAAPVTPRPLAAVPAPPSQTTVRPAVRDLLVAARASSSKRTVALAARADALLVQIRDRVLAEEKAEAEREERAREQAEARAEVQRLKDQLREAQAKLNGTGMPGRHTKAHAAGDPAYGFGTRPYEPDYPIEEVRAWAHANGHPVRGRYLSKEIVAAWREATGGGA